MWFDDAIAVDFFPWSVPFMKLSVLTLALRPGWGGIAPSLFTSGQKTEPQTKNMGAIFTPLKKFFF